MALDYSPPTADLRLLVVDDNDAFRMLLRARVRRERDPAMRIVGEACDGHGAIDAARTLQPDVVVLDVQMPSLDGIEALPFVLEAAPQAWVLMYSANDGLRAQALAAGAHAWVTKGDGWDAMRSTIHGLVRSATV